MNRSAPWTLFAMLELLALLLSLGTWVWLRHQEYSERGHIFPISVSWMFCAGAVGWLSGSPRRRPLMITGVLLLSLLCLGAGSVGLVFLGYHERAIMPLGVGTICFVGGGWRLCKDYYSQRAEERQPRR